MCHEMAEPYDGSSDWCVPCVMETLAEQEKLRYEEQRPEFVDASRYSVG